MGDNHPIDTVAGTCTGFHQHWMCGQRPIETSLDLSVPLADLLGTWIARSEPPLDRADRFWKLPDTAAEEKLDESVEVAANSHVFSKRRGPSEFDITKCRPQHDTSVPGWFTAPSSECTELVVNATLSIMTLFRVLLDPQGRPIRAALLVSCPNHDEVEEYDVKLCEK